MEWHYCFRCKDRVPLLDDSEFASVQLAYATSTQNLRDLAAARGWNHAKARHAELFLPVFDEYERITGVRVQLLQTALHHDLSNFGPVCADCGRLLRTPRAKHCAECGAPRPAA